MGWKLERIDLSGYHRIKPNEEIDLCIVLDEEKRAAIHGEVKFPNGKPVEGAVVKLFKKRNQKVTATTVTWNQLPLPLQISVDSSYSE